jgi:hypothetical protein
MIEYTINSTISLIILYGFYYLFLRNIKTIDFNRFYLLFSVLFSILMPLFTIDWPALFNFHRFSNLPDQVSLGQRIVSKPFYLVSIPTIWIILYSIVSLILLLRFALNIYKIKQLVHLGPVVRMPNYKIVLLENETLPYSFFRCIFVNKSDYENSKIEKELLIHEQAHCFKYHSVDIILVEIILIFLWFNPLIWFFKNAIKINHEYLADDKVLSDYDLNNYQNILITLVFRNNSAYLASNFNYSFTKKRLLMMKKKKSIINKLRIIMAIPLYLFLGLVITYAQNSPKAKYVKVKQNDTLSTSSQTITKRPVGEGDPIPPPPPPPQSSKKRPVGEGDPVPPPPSAKKQQ